MDQGETPKPNASEQQDVNPELSPQQKYESMLGRYVNLMDRIRTLERLNRPEEERYEVDRERSSLHREMLSLGTTLKKDKDGVYLDILSQEGNLKDYGVNAPVIRLPMVGTYFRYHAGKDTFSSINPYDKKHGLPHAEAEMTLTSPDGEVIAKYIPRRSWPFVQDKSLSGGVSEVEKWDKKPYCAIIFQMSEDVGNYGFGEPFALPLNITRLERMKNLAKDFSLNIFRGYNMGGHQDYFGTNIYGVEVPIEKIDLIASAMRSTPEKYWLTKAELDDPYKEEFLRQEAIDDIVKIGRSVREINDEQNNWKDWYNLLRVFHVGFTKPVRNMSYFKFITSEYLPMPYDSDLSQQQALFEKALKKAREENPAAASDMERLKKEVDAFLNKHQV